MRLTVFKQLKVKGEWTKLVLSGKIWTKETEFGIIQGKIIY